jgi:hypothetical protein
MVQAQVEADHDVRAVKMASATSTSTSDHPKQPGATGLLHPAVEWRDVVPGKHKLLT